MNNYGFVKVAAAIPNLKVADAMLNAKVILAQIVEADKKGVEILVFPELSITAYSCADLFMQEVLLREAHKALEYLISETQSLDIIFIVGMPIRVLGMALLNTAVVCQSGKALAAVAKTYLPNYGEFYEDRWFTSADRIDTKSLTIAGRECPLTSGLFKTPDFTFAVEICEDLWAPIPVSSELALKGAEIIFNLSADTECVNKHSYLKSLIMQQSARLISGYVYSSCGFGESTTDVVFAGNAMIYENGAELVKAKRFSFQEQLIISDIDVEKIRSERVYNTTFIKNASKFQKIETELIPCKGKVYSNNNSITNNSKINNSNTDNSNADNNNISHNNNDSNKNNNSTETHIFPELNRTFQRNPFVPLGPELNSRCEDIFSIQVSGLASRLLHINLKNVVLGISGGLDSTLALLVCVKTFDKLGYSRKGIIGVTMPGFGTTDRTYSNAINLMKELGITIREISIKEACIGHFKDINHDINIHDVVYENSQARERTQIIMDISNSCGGIVVGTGDMSELALGWATYNGDQMSMYGVNSSVPKTLVKHLVNWVANGRVSPAASNILVDVVDTPISPELIPADSKGNILQKTEDLVGPYELHDFFMYYFLRFGFTPSKIFYLAKLAFKTSFTDELILKWLRTFVWRFFAQQFKRSCMPDGPKVGSVTLSPRGDWRMPSDASVKAWIRDLEKIVL